MLVSLRKDWERVKNSLAFNSKVVFLVKECCLTSRSNGGGNIDIDWKSVYSLYFRTTLESKLREFQFKILNRIVFTNEKMFRRPVLSAKQRLNP